MSVDIISDIYNGDEIANNHIKNKLKLLYPDIDPNFIDKDLLHDIIINIINNDYETIEQINKDMISDIINLSNNNNNNNNNKPKKEETKDNIKYVNSEIVKQNILMADEIIPEMSMRTNLIYLNGKLNGKNINIMVDTGATSCVINKSIVDECGMNDLIDTNSCILVTGAHGIKPTLGTIWFCEIDLEISKNNYVSIPISVIVNDDSEIINAKKIINNYENKINQLTHNKQNMDNISSDFQLILGMTFLKSYRANIDFGSMSITLNNSIEIKFKN